MATCVVACATKHKAWERGPEAHAAKVMLQDGTRSHELKLLLACSEEERATGLMHRRRLDDADGMVFVFGASAVRTFWMHNTYLPLDMLFFDAQQKLVCTIDRAEPLTETPRGCALPSATVVELHGGAARRMNLSPNTVIQMSSAKLASLCAGP